MDERTRLFLWLLLSCGYFAFLGGVFGGVTGFVTWRDGRAAGGWLGRSVARAFARLRDEPLSGAADAVLVGCVDGVCFGLVVGLALGLFTGWSDGGGWRLLGPLMLGGLLLVVGALLFGTMASTMAGTGTRAVVGLFVGGVLGGGVGLWLGSLNGLYVGALLGAAAGALVARAAR